VWLLLPLSSHALTGKLRLVFREADFPHGKGERWPNTVRTSKEQDVLSSINMRYLFGNCLRSYTNAVRASSGSERRCVAATVGRCQLWSCDHDGQPAPASRWAWTCSCRSTPAGRDLAVPTCGDDHASSTCHDDDSVDAGWSAAATARGLPPMRLPCCRRPARPSSANTGHIPSTSASYTHVYRSTSTKKRLHGMYRATSAFLRQRCQFVTVSVYQRLCCAGE